MKLIKLIARVYSSLYILLGLVYLWVTLTVFKGDIFGILVIVLALGIGYVPAVYVLFMVGWKK